MFLTKRCWPLAPRGIRQCNKEQYPFKPSFLSSPIIDTNLGTSEVDKSEICGHRSIDWHRLDGGVKWRLQHPDLVINSYKVQTHIREVEPSSQHVIAYNFCCCLTNICTFFIVNTPHFLTIKGVEVNAGQTASFHCTVNGRKRDNFRLWLQVRSIFLVLHYTLDQRLDQMESVLEPGSLEVNVY